jgi:hypothetical protein
VKTEPLKIWDIMLFLGSLDIAVVNLLLVTRVHIATTMHPLKPKLLSGLLLGS